ncbi:hypothetical protein B0H66DRAFT_559925 [Apodospora peruviana]|uniref:Stress-response A/B barrel domain-containing protein n=1 Tax=Apodospora peruviana TaxID=516989 RepID=A0AAE0I1K8_9PEZI|nr:hypothetical protein B0H66DRAFT_559925 [Apodospora peruviana]
MVRTRHLVAIILTVLFSVSIFFKTRDFIPSFIFITATARMTLTHTVLFQFKADANRDDVKAACTRFLALQQNCLHPTTQTPYIISLKGGKDNSPEGLQNGITHGFVVGFATAEDRDYYVAKDPAHLAFVKSIDGLVEKATVVDFTNGVF